MYLNILVDNDYYYAFDLVKKMYSEGYDMNVNILGGVDKSNVYNKIKSNQGEYKNIFITAPRNSFIDHKSKEDFFILDSRYFPLNKEEIHILSKMDVVFVFNSHVQNSINKQLPSTEVILINNYFNKRNTRKVDSITNFICNDNKYLNEILHTFIKLDKKRITIVTKDIKATKFKVEKFRCLNGINDFSNVLVVDDYKREMSLVDCCINIQDGNEFSRMVLDSIHCGVPVVLSDHFLYSDFCRKNNSVITDIKNLKEDLKLIDVRRVDGAKKIVDKLYSFNNFYSKFISNIKTDNKYKNVVPERTKYVNDAKNIII